MELENNFHDLFFTKKGWIGISRMLITTLVICVIMCAIECSAIYALEITRFEASLTQENNFAGYVWGRDFGIAIALAWPLAWILSNAIPVFWVRHVFEPAAKKSGKAPSTGQKIAGFVTITFCIALVESFLMSLMMYAIDTQVVVPDYMHHLGVLPEQVKHPIPFVGKYWARVWGSAFGVSFGAALIVTAIMPMLMKKLFMKIDGMKANKAEVPFNETDLVGKVEYLEGNSKDIDTLTIKKSKKAKSKK